MKHRATYLLIVVFLLQTGLGLSLRQIGATEYTHIMATQLIALLLPAALYLLLFQKPTSHGHGRGCTVLNACFAVILMVCVSILNQYINAPVLQLLTAMGLESNASNQTLQAAETGFEFGLSVVFLCLVPAIVEELLFRGIVLSEYTLAYGYRRAIALTAVVYAIMHFELTAFVPQVIIGLLTAYLVYQTKSLLPGIIAHFTNNFFGLLIQQCNASFAQVMTSYAFGIVAGAFLLFSFISVCFYKYNQPEQLEQIDE